MTAPLLPSHYAQQVTDALGPGGRWERVHSGVGAFGIVPSAKDLAELFDIAFFASTSKEEGRQARFSIALSKPQRWRVHRLAKPIPLTVENLRKLSAACHANATALSVDIGRAGWMIWGIGVNTPPARRGARVAVPEDSLVLSVTDAGVLALRSSHAVIFKYEGGQGVMPAAPTLVHDIIAKVLPPGGDNLQLHHLSAIARAMRAHTRGGALLVVPSAVPPTITFRYEILQERIKGLRVENNRILGETDELHVVAPLADAARIEKSHLAREAQQKTPSDVTSADMFALHSVEWTDIEGAQIGRLTAVDGIVAITHEMAVLGFGGKIPVPEGFGDTEVVHIDPQSGSERVTVIKDVFSGMRHSSAAAACIAHGRDALALVQSQDGALTVMITTDDGVLWVVRPLDRLVPYLER